MSKQHELELVIQEILELHTPDKHGYCPQCKVELQTSYLPCPTVQLLDANNES